MRLLCLTLIAATCSIQAQALEASAVRDATMVEMTGVNMKTDSLEALVTAVTNGMMKCESKSMRFAPGQPGIDADKCLDTPVSRCAKINKVYLPNSVDRDANGCVSNVTPKVELCANQRKLYAPGSTTPPADANGCIENIGNKVQVCASYGALFMPSSASPAPDANGCVYNINAYVSRCAQQSKVYVPGAAGADGNGCVAMPSGNGSGRSLVVGACRTLDFDNKKKPRCANDEVVWGADNNGMTVSDKKWYADIVCCKMTTQ